MPIRHTSEAAAGVDEQGCFEHRSRPWSHGTLCSGFSLWPEADIRDTGQEDPLEEGTATHSSILAWRIPWTEEPGGLQSRGLQRAGVCAHAQLLYTAVSISAVHRSESAICIHTSPLFWISFAFRSPQSNE